jgi:hypothetical protein
MEKVASKNGNLLEKVASWEKCIARLKQYEKKVEAQIVENADTPFKKTSVGKYA